MVLLLLLRRHRMMGMLLCRHGVRGHVVVFWPHLLLIPQHSGGEVGWMHHRWRLHILLTVQPNRISAAAAVLFCCREDLWAWQNSFYWQTIPDCHTSNHHRSPSGSFLLLAVAGLDFLLLMVDPRLLIPLMTDMVSSSPPYWSEFLYEMSGSQQSSRCRAIWNVMNRSRYMWL